MRERKKWAGTGILLTAALALQFLARYTKGFADWYGTRIYPYMVMVVGGFFSVFPFSAAELGLYLFLIWALLYTGISVVLLIRKKGARGAALRNYCGTLALTAAALLLVFTLFCGVNYHRISFSEYEGFIREQSSKEELDRLCRFLAEEINRCDAAISGEGDGRFAGLDTMEEQAVLAVKAAGETYESLSGFTPEPKAVWQSVRLSKRKITGIYSPFTIEANYNRDMPLFNVPSTLCHELSHLKGYMREDEANFVAWLACMASDQPQFVYSGHMLAFGYAMDALWNAGEKDAYREIYAGLCRNAKEDLQADSEFWHQYDGKTAEVSKAVNDTYLKLNSQEDGVKSYGRMVDLLLAYRREEFKDEENRADGD